MDMQTIPVERLLEKLTLAKSIYTSHGVIAAIEYINSTPLIASHIGNQMQATTLIHELYHAIRQDSHTTGSHGAIEYVLHNIKCNYDYDKGIFEIFGAILANGFWGKFLEKI